MEQSEARAEAPAEACAFWVPTRVRIAEAHKCYIFQAGSIVQYDPYVSLISFSPKYILLAFLRIYSPNFSWQNQCILKLFLNSHQFCGQKTKKIATFR